MAKAVIICTRSCDDKRFSRDDYLRLSARLVPDNIHPRPPFLIEEKGITIAIYNPALSIQVKNSSVCLGKLTESRSDWSHPGDPVPDGSYAIFRSNQDRVEIITDFLASRTIWFVHTDDIFIASTSQRAIVYFLGSFVPNRETFSWMLSCGNLGPGLSWDKRLQSLKGNSCLGLDREGWTIQIRHQDLVFNPRPANEQEHRQQLQSSIQTVLKNIPLERNKWLLPLSGGYDSRTILSVLRNRKDIRCVTWGLRASLKDPLSDGFIAKRLAAHFGFNHEFFTTDVVSENFDKLFDRFLAAGEGRIDHISGYMDGFAMWKNFFESDYAGIIRGDQGFGWLDIKDARHIRHSLECFFAHEYMGGLELNSFDFPKQDFPETLKRRKNESLAAWRDRFFLEFRVPYVKAALSDLKLAYAEVISPFLTRAIMEKVLELPDHLRTNKALFREIAIDLSPAIDFAQNMSIATPEDILSNNKILSCFYNDLDSKPARQLLSNKLINIILRHLVTDRDTRGQKNCFFFPRFIYSKIRNYQSRFNAKKPPDYRRLALRACLILKMNEILRDDAQILRQ